MICRQWMEEARTSRAKLPISLSSAESRWVILVRLRSAGCPLLPVGPEERIPGHGRLVRRLVLVGPIGWDVSGTNQRSVWVRRCRRTKRSHHLRASTPCCPRTAGESSSDSSGCRTATRLKSRRADCRRGSLNETPTKLKTHLHPTYRVSSQHTKAQAEDIGVQVLSCECSFKRESRFALLRYIPSMDYCERPLALAHTFNDNPRMSGAHSASTSEEPLADISSGSTVTSPARHRSMNTVRDQSITNYGVSSVLYGAGSVPSVDALSSASSSRSMMSLNFSSRCAASGKRYGFIICRWNVQ